MRFDKLVTAAVLGFTLWASLASSILRDEAQPETGLHYIISDCVTPTAEAEITISNSTIIAPGGVSFTDFGFPVTSLSQTVTGAVGSATRECTVTYGESGTNNVNNRWLYSCFDNGTFKCSIYIQPR